MSDVGSGGTWDIQAVLRETKLRARGHSRRMPAGAMCGRRVVLEKLQELFESQPGLLDDGVEGSPLEFSVVVGDYDPQLGLLKMSERAVTAVEW